MESGMIKGLYLFEDNNYPQIEPPKAEPLAASLDLRSRYKNMTTLAIKLQPS